MQLLRERRREPRPPRRPRPDRRQPLVGRLQRRELCTRLVEEDQHIVVGRAVLAVQSFQGGCAVADLGEPLRVERDPLAVVTQLAREVGDLGGKRRRPLAQLARRRIDGGDRSHIARRRREQVGGRRRRRRAHRRPIGEVAQPLGVAEPRLFGLERERLAGAGPTDSISRT
jgi:hypothetical protein